MANTNALAILAGINQKDRDHASAPTNLHVLSGEVYSKSEEGRARILLDGLVFSEEDSQWIEVDSLGGLEEGDTATILLAGEEGKGMTPLALGTVGGIDRIVVRVDAIEADYVKATVLDAQIARIDELEADTADISTLVAQKANISDLTAAVGRIDDLEADTATISDLVAEKADIDDLTASNARISSLETDNVDVKGRLTAAEADIDSLETDNVDVKGRLTAAEADIDTLEANSLTADSAVIKNLEADTAKVHNLTAAQLSAASAYIADLTAGNVTAQNIIADKAKLAQLDVDEISADHATIESLDTTYATITNLNSATARISTIEADYLKAADMTAEVARVGTLLADKADVDDLEAAEARIGSLEADHVTVADFQAEQGYIDQLQANTADIATIRANAAKVQNLTAAQLEADHATIGQLDTTYMHANMSNSDVAWIQNGTIKDGAITNAMINSVSANKLTAGTIDASDITVTNLNADNITTGTINGQRIGEGSLSLSKLEDDVYTEAEVDAKLSTMQAEIDGAIETWTGTAVPTLNNTPASGWTTAAERDRHVGDVYFVVNSNSQQNGYNYRFTKSGSTYSWQLIKDTDITNALQRLTTAEGKITTFDSDISQLKTDTGTLTTKTESLETSLGDKVDVTTFNEVSDTVDEHSQSITQLTNTTTTALQRGIEYINGTQTASTGSWTGVTTDSALYTGKTIAYRLPYAGNGNASLQLKNSSGGNVGGNIAVYMNNTRVTTHYPANTVIKMTYDGTYWRTDNYDANTYDREKYSASVTASGAIAAGRIGVFGTDGQLKLLAVSAFDMTRPILYIGTAYTDTALTQTNNYVYYGAPFALTNTHAITGAVAGKAVYIVGTINGNVMTPTSTVLTCTEPSTADGYFYLRLGTMTTTTSAILESNHPLYAYVDGTFQQATPQVVSTTTKVSEHTQTIDGISTRVGSLETTITTKADSSTVTTISNKLNTVSDTVDGHTQSISSVQNTLATKADSSTVSTLTTKVNNVSDTVDGHTSQLTSVQNTLATKADSSTVSTLTTKVNNVSDTVDGHTSQLSNITTTQTTMQSTLDKTVKSSIQLWYSKANTTAPSAPTSQVTSTSTSGNAWRIVVPAYNASYPHYFYCWQYEYVDGTYGWSAVVRDIAMGESQSTARTADSNASAAVTTANTASTNASTALTTANTANTNASEAKTTATTASTTASEAKTMAETAASDASTAKTNAASAVSTANSASTTATNAQSTANANIKSSVQLWFTKANSTAPTKPTSVVSTSNANTANAWNLVVPVWNQNYPHYFYCYQQQKGDGTYQWTDVVYDRATSEAQQLANTTSTNLSTLQEDYAEYKQTTTEAISTIGTTIDEKIADISVGGRNLLKLSDTLDSSCWTLQNATVTDGVATITVGSGNGRIYQMPANGYWTWEANTDYVASVEAKASEAGGAISINGVGAHSGAQRFDITTEWKRYEYAFTSASNPDTGSLSFFNNGATGSVVQFRYPKLERGTKATDWTPAPEDMATARRVAAAETSITQNANQIALRATKTEVFDTGNMLKDTNVSVITKVYGPSNRYWSDAAQTHITPSFVALTDPPEPDITHAAQFVSDGSKASYAARGVAFYSGENTTNIPMKEGQTYTASWWARKTSGSGMTRFAYRSGGAFVTAARAGKTDYDDELTTEWKQYTRTFTMGEVTDYNRVWFYGCFPASTAGTVQLCGFKIVPAAYATAAELKVASDSIDLKVSKNDVINQINVSTEGAKIQASKVEIDGTAVFNAISSDVDDAITGKGYQTASQVNTAITSKGYATTTQAQGYATTAKSEAISAAATDATSKANAAETNAKAYTDSVEIGGRNLLLWTGEGEAYSAHTAVVRRWDFGTIYGTNVVTGNTVTFTKNGSGLANNTSGIRISAMLSSGSMATGSDTASLSFGLDLVPGDTYTFSCDVKTSGNRVAMHAQYFDGTTRWKNAGSITEYGAPADTDWHRYFHTFTVNSDYVSLTALGIYCELTEGVTIAAKNFKMERGNKPTDWTPAPEDIDASIETASGNGFYVKWDDNQGTTYSGGEARFYAYDPVTKTTGTDVGWVLWNGVKRTVPRKTFNPNTAYPYNIPIYLVLRLSSATSTTGTMYAVWYNGGWKSADPDASVSSTISDWTWVEATDIVLASCVEPAAEAQFTDCQTYDPPLLCTQVTTITTTAASAQALATTANTTADNAAPKANAVKRTQRIYWRTSAAKNSWTMPTAWLAVTGDVFDQWTCKVPRLTANADGTGTKYLYLYTCEQREMADGTLAYTTVLLDDTTTVIDGGTLITGSITANKLNASDINASHSLTIGALSTDTQDDILNSNVVVGGRNLLAFSSLRNTTNPWTSNGLTYTWGSDGWITIKGTCTNTAAALGFTFGSGTQTYQYLPAGTYTLTVESENFLDGTNTYTAIQLGTRTSSDTTKYYVLYDSGSVTGVADLYVSRVSILLQAAANGKTYDGRIRLKLETGNKPTDWTPAPEDVAADISDAAETATNYITHVDNNGITVHPSGTTNNRIAINANGMQVYKNNVDVASYGDTARIGKANSSRFLMNADSLQAYNSSNTKYFEVSASGMTYGTSTVATTDDIPTKVSELTNDSSFATASDVSTAVKSVSQNWFATCTTAADMKDKVATITPATTDFSLKAGATVNVKFTNTNTYSATASSNVTLNVNGTGAKNIYYGASSAPTGTNTTPFGRANYTNTYVYDGAYWVWVSSSADNNTTDVPRSKYEVVLTAAAAITKGHIICGTSSGYRNIAADVAFDLNYPLLYAATAIAAGATSGTRNNNFTKYQGVTFSNNGTITSGAASKMLYLKGTVDGKTFTISASPFLTTVIPTSDDGLAYIPIGYMSSATVGYFDSSADVYAFRNGAFQKLDTVAKYITSITDAGIRVHAKNNPTTNYAAIDADGMDVVKGGVSVAKFGETARIGTESSSHVFVTPTQLGMVSSVGAEAMTISSSSSTLSTNISQNWYQELLTVPKAADSQSVAGASVSLKTLEPFKSEIPSNAKMVFGVKSEPGARVIEFSSDYSTSFSDLGLSFTWTASTKTLTASNTNTQYAWTIILTSYYWVEQTLAPHFSFGTENMESANYSSGAYAMSIGAGNIASGDYSFTQGLNCTASAAQAHAEGNGTTASAAYAHAEGNGTTASAAYAHAEGYQSVSNGLYSHAEGQATHAGGFATHAEGNGSTTSNSYSHAEGWNTQASGTASHAQGQATIASHELQTAMGKLNRDLYGTALEIGNGTSVNSRSNAMSVEWTGKLNLIDQDMPTSAPSSSYWATGNGLYLYDGDSDTSEIDAADAIGYVRPAWRSDNGRGVQIETQRTVNDVRTANGIALTVNDSGDPFVILDRSAWLRALGISHGNVAALGNTAASAYKDKAVSFGITYSSAPNVIVGFKSDSTAGTFGRCSVSAHSITTTGFTLRFFNGDSSNRNPEFYWIAIGVPVNH